MLETELDNKEHDDDEPAGSGEARAAQEPQAVASVPVASQQPSAGLTPAMPAAAPVPAASFQPPQVIFQPPAVVAAATNDDEGGAAHEPDADEEGAGGSRRRRRRGGRGRGKGGDGDGGGGPQEPAASDADATGSAAGYGAGGSAHHGRDDRRQRAVAASDEPGTGTGLVSGTGTPADAPRPARSRKRGGSSKDREASAPEDAAKDAASDGTASEAGPSGTGPSGTGSSGTGSSGTGSSGTGSSGTGRSGTVGAGAAARGTVGEAKSGTSRTRRGRSARAQDDQEPTAEPGSAQPDIVGDEHEEGFDGDGRDGESAATRRRRRRRRRGGAGDAEPVGTDDPPNTVVHVREPRPATIADRDEVQSVKGSTRLEAKKQRRREGRDSGRRRPPVLSESEFLARREAVQRVMLVRQKAERTQIAVLEDGVLVEHYVDRATHQSMAGNIYLGKVQNVLPSMEAAFVDIGKGRNAVLYAGEINFDASGLEGQPKRIEMVLKSGQSVLVQVTKDPVGHKGARLTNQVSLPGRYLVYVPGASMTGISRKLPVTERTRLKQILKKVTPENGGVIVRTAAEGTGEEELSRDVARLAAQWENIAHRAASANPPELLYSEPDLTIRVVRDIFNEDFSELVVAGDDGWDTVNEYVRYVAPHLAGRLRRWDGDTDVFASYRIDEQLAKALERKVWLPSGGSLVIDRTEAMTVIDVNTGKFTGQGGNLEETVTRNNLEAAEEIVRQLRLRDIGGIIVVDFIDMVLESNRELVLRRMLECLARDRTKHQVAEVTSLGLVQMTRKRVGSGLLEAFSEPCECCNGRGLHVSIELLEAPPGKRPQAVRGGRGDTRSQGDERGQSDVKGQGDARGQSDARDQSDAKGQGGVRGQGDAKGHVRGSGGENGKRRGAESAVTDVAAGDGGTSDDGARGGSGGGSGSGGGVVAEGPRESVVQAEDKPWGRRRRRRQPTPGGNGGPAHAPATDAGPIATEQPGDGGTEPGHTEPGHTHAGHTEPAHSEAAHTQPVHTQPGRTEPGQSEPGHADAGRTEPGQSEPGHADAGRTELGQSEPGHADAGRTEPGHADAGRTESGRTESGRTESGRTESGRTESGGTEPGPADPGDRQHGRTESGHTDAGNNEPRHTGPVAGADGAGLDGGYGPDGGASGPDIGTADAGGMTTTPDSGNGPGFAVAAGYPATPPPAALPPPAVAPAAAQPETAPAQTGGLPPPATPTT